LDNDRPGGQLIAAAPRFGQAEKAMNKMRTTAMMKMNAAKIARVLVVILAAVIAACSGDDGGQTAAPVVRPAKIVEIQDPARELARVFPGVVVSAEDTMLSFRVGGRLASLPVDKQVGALVGLGDVLATLDPVDYQNALSNAEASFQLALTQFKRASELVEDGYVSQTDFDRLKARYLSKQAELNQAKTNLGYTELRAPFRGRISTVLVKNFESVRTDQAIAILEDADKVDVEIQVPTSVMAQISDQVKADYRARGQGQHVYDVEFENTPGLRYPAVVSESETRPDPATLTYRTVVSMPLPEGVEVLAGLNAKVHLDLALLSEIRPRIHIPLEAVFNPEDMPMEEGFGHVWLLDPNTMTISLRRVAIGPITEFGMVVSEGLEPGDSIVAAGVHMLTEGTQVRRMAREMGL
jgi:RND family efflux transporter MFP subunit